VSAASPFTGRVVSDRYETGELFEHAHAARSKLLTHLGRDRATGEQVLVVVLRPELARDPAVRAEYAWGLERVAPLDHPGIAAIRAWRSDDAAGELVYITDVLPWHSRSIARLLRDGGVFRETEIVSIARLVLDALGHAHDRGIAFGNVKTSNLLVAPGAARVVNNGLPKPPFQFASIPQLGAYLGKPFACAPELIATGRFDARADLYGLGLVLYELVAGRLPHHAQDNLGVFFHSIIHDELPPVQDANPEVSTKLADAIARAVAKDPAARFASAAEMAAAIARVQARPVAMLTRERLVEMTTTAMPSPIAHAYAAIGAQLDDPARLQRVVDAASACVTFVGAVVVGARLRAKLEPIADAAARAQLARPSLGHWVAIAREGTREPLAALPELTDALWTQGRPSPTARAIDALVALRNDIRHGAAPSVGVARRKLDEHVPLLERVLADLRCLRDARLIVPRKLDVDDDELACEVDVLRGTRSPERRSVRLPLAQPVSIGRLYLATADLRDPILLAPLVVLATCPVCEDEELFVYESASAERIHYLSWQKGHALATTEPYTQFKKLGLLA
jgi:hypothetical protein